MATSKGSQKLAALLMGASAVSFVLTDIENVLV